MRVSAEVVRQRVGALAWVIAGIFTSAALVDEIRRNCGTGGPRGALLVAAGITAGLAAAVHASGRRSRQRSVAFGIAVAAGLMVALFVFASLNWVHNCAN
jgi:hypothetical protein